VRRPVEAATSAGRASCRHGADSAISSGTQVTGFVDAKSDRQECMCPQKLDRGAEAIHDEGAIRDEEEESDQHGRCRRVEVSELEGSVADTCSRICRPFTVS
jgi:hypothetical protein